MDTDPTLNQLSRQKDQQEKGERIEVIQLPPDSGLRALADELKKRGFDLKGGTLKHTGGPIWEKMQEPERNRRKHNPPVD